MDEDARNRNPLGRFINTVAAVLDTPVVWFREKIVEPNRQTYPWYHQKFRRVPTIDECYTDDAVCQMEANVQFKRDRLVDSAIVHILKLRFEDCALYEKPLVKEKCTAIHEQYEKAAENWFIKYGDLGGYGGARDAYMKQKHRMIWERRHGPVGSGMKDTAAEA